MRLSSVPDCRVVMNPNFQPGEQVHENWHKSRAIDVPARRVVIGPPDSPSYWHYTGRLYFLGISIPKQYLADLSDELDIPNAQADIVEAFAIKDDFLSEMLSKIASRVFAFGELDSLYVESIAETLAQCLLTEYRYSSNRHQQVNRSIHKPTLTRHQKKRLEAFVTAYLDQNLSLDMLCDVIGLKTRRFSELFKNTFGMTPHVYVQRSRLERAKALLKDNRDSISTIAELTGFSSQAHLTTVFRTHVGATPARYRAAYRGDSMLGGSRVESSEAGNRDGRFIII